MIFKYFQIFLFSLISSILISVILFLTTDISFFANTKELLQTYIIIFLINLICTIILFRFLPLISSKNLIQLTSKKDQELIALKSAEKYRREFFGNVSHELKTPIFNIQGYVETLIDGAMHDKSVNKKYLKRTSKSIDRLITIIDDEFINILLSKKSDWCWLELLMYSLLPWLDHAPHFFASLAPKIETTGVFVAAAICIGAESIPKKNLDFDDK